MKKLRKKIIPMLMGIAATALCLWALLTSNLVVDELVNRLNYMIYDRFTKVHPAELNLNDNRVAIVDIDEKSMREIGRWPWSRTTISELAKKVQASGATVVAFDIFFSDPEKNIAELVIQKAGRLKLISTNTLASLNELLPAFDADEEFAHTVSNGDFVLGMVFHNDKANAPIGSLPSPIAELDPKVANALIGPEMTNYTGNLPHISTAAKNTGFVTVFPDVDGVIRRVPLVLLYKNTLYPSLALEAARLHLLVPKTKIILAPAGDAMAVDAIKLGDSIIHTDASGQILVPFQRPHEVIRYVSAADIMKAGGKKIDLSNTIVFIGSSALGMGDFHATAMTNEFPGVEIQATIAAGLLAGQFPSYPSWGRGLEIMVIVGLGLLSAALFPFLGALILALCTLLLVALAFGFSFYLWTQGFVLPVILPTVVVALNAALSLTYGFFFEFRSRIALKDAFGQYVPPQRVAMMSENPKQYGFEGRSAELSVLFSDIVGFTSVSEKLDAEGVRSLLNNFLTPMTKIVFDSGGTIDKYVGDMIMAFWGAPVEDAAHATNAMTAALGMQKRASELRIQFAAEGKLPPVSVGIGVNSGEMSVGDMGSTYRRAYTVLGDTVNLASRLEALTRHYFVDIIVGEGTKNKSDAFLYRLLDRVKVKGKSKAIEIFELISTKSEANAEIIAEVAQHEEAIQLYFSQNWTTAQEKFSALLAGHPQSKLYVMYLERIAELSKNSPGADWDGSYEWHTK